MTEHNEFTSFIDDELERVGNLFAEKTAAVFCWR